MSLATYFRSEADAFRALPPFCRVKAVLGWCLVPLLAYYAIFNILAQVNYVRHKALMDDLISLQHEIVFNDIESVKERITPGCYLLGDADAQGMTPLLLAVMRGRREIAEILLDNGADANQQKGGQMGGTPLILAVNSNQPLMVELLLAHGANVNLPATYGITPLHVAAGHGNCALAQQLLAAGADTQALAFGRYTPLDIALQQHHADVAALLTPTRP